MPPKALSRFAERGAGWGKPPPTSAQIALRQFRSPLIYFLGAAVLSDGGGGMPKKDKLIETLSSMYTETLGPWAYYILYIQKIFKYIFKNFFFSVDSCHAHYYALKKILYI